MKQRVRAAFRAFLISVLQQTKKYPIFSYKFSTAELSAQIILAFNNLTHKREKRSFFFCIPYSMLPPGASPSITPERCNGTAAPRVMCCNSSDSARGAR